MTDDELDGYLVLILFMLKKKKSWTSKKSENFWVREIFKKRPVYGLSNNFDLGIGSVWIFQPKF